MCAGGLKLFNNTTNGGYDLLSEMSGRGYSVLYDRKSLVDEPVSLPVLGLFAESHMDYEIDRVNAAKLREQQPSLPDMAAKALELLEDSPSGFFLMIEGSRIDMAGHSNDAAAMFHEIQAYQDTVTVVEQFVERNERTLVLSVSDHETGGFAIGADPRSHDTDSNYRWNPWVIPPLKASAEKLASLLLQGAPIAATFKNLTGFDLDDWELKTLQKKKEHNLDLILLNQEI